MGQTVYADGRRDRLQAAKDIVAKFYPGGDAPAGLLTELYRALGEAELNGFRECMELFEQRSSPDNDNRVA